MKALGGRLLELILWIALLVVLVALFEQRSAPRYHCVVYGSRPGVHNQLLCYDDNGRMFRPERRFNKFTLENGEP